MKFLFNNTRNLLQKRHDKITDLFTEGVISYREYEDYEKAYKISINLFTVNLN